MKVDCSDESKLCVRKRYGLRPALDVLRVRRKTPFNFALENMIRALLLVVSFYATAVIAAESKPIPLHATERQFQDFITSLKVAARRKDAAAVYALLASDYYVSRDFGGSFDPSVSPARNFSANFEFNNDNLRPEYKDYGWVAFRRAISGGSFEKKHDGQVCTPHGALDKKPFPHSQLCFRKLNSGWKIQGHINGGDWNHVL